jgi:hypothetical protein
MLRLRAIPSVCHPFTQVQPFAEQGSPIAGLIPQRVATSGAVPGRAAQEQEA